MALFNVPLSCVFFAEFHTVLGPKISYQAPEGFIRADEFESISEYVIPKSQLCGRLVTLYDTIFFMKKKKKKKKTQLKRSAIAQSDRGAHNHGSARHARE